MYRVHATEGDPPEDEREDRGDQVGALGVAAGRHAALRSDLGQDVGQRVAPHSVHGPRPPGSGQRTPTGFRKLSPVHDLRCSEADQVVGLLGTARRGVYLIATGGQHGHGHAAHASGGPGDQHRTGLRRDVVILEGQDAEHGRVAGRPNGHGFCRSDAVREEDRPPAADPGPLGEPTPGFLTNPPAVHDYPLPDRHLRIVGSRHRASQVDAGDHGEVPYHGGCVGNG